jgi:Sec-independent protein translocase protein TatA
MGLFGHWFEILILLVLALVVFGPRRMIEMGSTFGKMFRELREATKDLSLQSLLREEETPQQTTLSKLSQFSQSVGAENAPADEPPANKPPIDDSARVVEGSTDPVEEARQP